MLSLNDIQGRAYIKFDNKRQLWMAKDIMPVKATQSRVRSVFYGHTILAISKSCYYTLQYITGRSKVYHFTEIDELKHLSQTTLTNSNWYDTVHVMD
jgi:hypothetical protein